MPDAPASANRDARLSWARRSGAWIKDMPVEPGGGDPVIGDLVAAANIVAGMRVVDLASGVGEPAISVARTVGAAGHVTATDFAAEMLSGARDRARRLGQNNMSFAVADMQALPFADGTFDAATCRCGLMFPDDPVLAASEARRVLRPGARAAFQVWGPQEGNPGYRATRYTVLPILGQDPDAPAPRHRFAASGALRAALAAAGFADVEERDIVETEVRPADVPVWRKGLQRSFAHQLATLDAETKERIDAALSAAFEEFRDGDVYRLRVHRKIGVGVVPA